MVISGNEKQTNKPKKQVFLNANGTSLNISVMIWWGELLVLHQGTQALITVSGASFVFLNSFFFLPRHWSHLAVQLYKLQNKNKPKKHKIGLCMIITKGNLKEFRSIMYRAILSSDLGTSTCVEFFSMVGVTSH